MCGPIAGFFFLSEVLRAMSRNALGCVCAGGAREQKSSQETNLGCRPDEIVRSGKDDVLNDVKRRAGSDL